MRRRAGDEARFRMYGPSRRIRIVQNHLWILAHDALLFKNEV
jgi:hypothetical protein